MYLLRRRSPTLNPPNTPILLAPNRTRRLPRTRIRRNIPLRPRTRRRAPRRASKPRQHGREPIRRTRLCRGRGPTGPGAVPVVYRRDAGEAWRTDRCCCVGRTGGSVGAWGTVGITTRIRRRAVILPSRPSGTTTGNTTRIQGGVHRGIACSRCRRAAIRSAASVPAAKRKVVGRLDRRAIRRPTR